MDFMKMMNFVIDDIKTSFEEIGFERDNNGLHIHNGLSIGFTNSSEKPFKMNDLIAIADDTYTKFKNGYIAAIVSENGHFDKGTVIMNPGIDIFIEIFNSENFKRIPFKRVNGIYKIFENGEWNTSSLDEVYEFFNDITGDIGTVVFNIPLIFSISNDDKVTKVINVSERLPSPGSRFKDITYNNPVKTLRDYISPILILGRGEDISNNEFISTLDIPEIELTYNFKFKNTDNLLDEIEDILKNHDELNIHSPRRILKWFKLYL